MILKKSWGQGGAGPQGPLDPLLLLFIYIFYRVANVKPCLLPPQKGQQNSKRVQGRRQQIFLGDLQQTYFKTLKNLSCVLLSGGHVVAGYLPNASFLAVPLVVGYFPDFSCFMALCFHMVWHFATPQRLYPTFQGEPTGHQHIWCGFWL